MGIAHGIRSVEGKALKGRDKDCGSPLPLLTHRPRPVGTESTRSLGLLNRQVYTDIQRFRIISRSFAKICVNLRESAVLILRDRCELFQGSFQIGGDFGGDDFRGG